MVSPKEPSYICVALISCPPLNGIVALCSMTGSGITIDFVLSTRSSTVMPNMSAILFNKATEQMLFPFSHCIYSVTGTLSLEAISPCDKFACFLNKTNFSGNLFIVTSILTILMVITRVFNTTKENPLGFSLFHLKLSTYLYSTNLSNHCALMILLDFSFLNLSSLHQMISYLPLLQSE